MMQQMIDNPQAMQNFSTAPYVQNLLESMEQDPDMAMRIFNMNPAVQRNPALQVLWLCHFVTSCMWCSFSLFLSYSSNIILVQVSLILSTFYLLLQEQLRTMLPNFMQQLQNPEVQNLAFNPQALSAIMQIQQGLDRLREAAPGMVNRLVHYYFIEKKLLGDLVT